MTDNKVLPNGDKKTQANQEQTKGWTNPVEFLMTCIGKVNIPK